MIFKWSEQNITKELEYVVDGQNEYKDERGKISNHELYRANKYDWIN